MDERGEAPRKRVLWKALIVPNRRNRFSFIECTVREFSPAGAQIFLPHAIDIPHEFDLDIPKVAQSFHARVVWSKDEAHGLSFVEAVGHEPIVIETDPASAAIQQVVDEARLRIAQIAGVAPDAVRLTLAIER